MAQIGGAVFKISIEDLKKELKVSPDLAVHLQRNEQEFALQAQQVVACNALHEIHQRLARWLLMSQDRVGGDVIRLTQQSLAYMLATRRASVTLAAGILQKAGLINYKRGSIKIENRKGLEEASCECYSALIRQISKWRNETMRNT
jgi:CRP-like cAMP-binding protein